MKAKIVQQKVYESVMDWNHRGGSIVRRLVIEEKDNLAITPYNDRVYAFTGFDLDDGCKIIGEVDVPDELIEKALTLIRVKAEFNGLKHSVEALLNI